MYTIKPGGLPVDISQEHAMEIEFGHGLGFGKRVKAIETIQRESSGWRIKGSIKIWWEDESQFSMLVDENLIVRNAVIESNVNGNLTRFEIETSGIASSEGFQLAQKGIFRRIAVGRLRDGKMLGKEEILKEFGTEFVSIKPFLTDAEYESLTDMTPSHGMQVEDHIAGVTYFVGGPIRTGATIGEAVSSIDTIEDAADTQTAVPATRDGDPNDSQPLKPGQAVESEETSSAKDTSKKPTFLRYLIVAGSLIGAVIVLAAITIRRRRALLSSK